MQWTGLQFLQQHLLLSANTLLFCFSLLFCEPPGCRYFTEGLRRDSAIMTLPRGPRKAKVIHAEKVSEGHLRGRWDTLCAPKYSELRRI